MSLIWLLVGDRHNDNSAIYQNIITSTQGARDAEHFEGSANHQSGSRERDEHRGMTATHLQEMVRTAVQSEMAAWAAIHIQEEKRVRRVGMDGGLIFFLKVDR